jgi:hypothetical protein
VSVRCIVRDLQVCRKVCKNKIRGGSCSYVRTDRGSGTSSLKRRWREIQRSPSTSHIWNATRPDRTITLRPRKRRKTIQHTRNPCSIYVTSCDELVYITAERGHWGTMLSELDELGRMICRRCVETKRLVEFRGVV